MPSRAVTVFANGRDAFRQPSKHRGPCIRESRMILRIVEASSCNRKNVRIRAHAGYKYISPMVETLSYTRENISNRSYIVSNIESVPTKPSEHCKTLRLWCHCFKTPVPSGSNHFDTKLIQIRSDFAVEMTLIYPRWYPLGCPRSQKTPEMNELEPNHKILKI